MGLCYASIAALNLYNLGVGSFYWLPWTLLATGSLALEFTPARENRKAPRTLIRSKRTKIGIALTVSGVIALVLVVILHRRH